MRQPEPERPWTLSLSAGGEYDSNPLLSGETIPRDDDYRGVWRARGSYRVFERGGFTLSTGAEGYWSIHHEEDQVDLQTYLGFVNTSYALGPVLLGLNYDFVYTFIDFSDPFRLLNRVTPSVSVREGDIGLTQIYYQFNQFNFYHQNLLTPALDLDGHEQYVGVSQYFFLPAPVSYVRVGALGDFTNTHGTEFSTWATSCSRAPRSRCRSIHSSRCSIASPIATSTTTASSRPNAKQHAKIHRVTLELIKTITPHIDVSLAGSLAFRNSNIPVFDYNRYIGGGYVTYRF